MTPVDLRQRLETSINKYIDLEAWERTGLAESAEQESLRVVLGRWKGHSETGIDLLPGGAL
ncbi:MAG TPA: hypothetical protein VMT85_07190 [Thermoanaerobaculia bacterium]|nr:hypothetical protein [Thermoanaerobaculia bacterium]